MSEAEAPAAIETETSPTNGAAPAAPDSRRFARSKSQMGTYDRCPRQYRYNYVDRIKVSGYWAVRGIAAHAGLEANYKHKLNTGQDLPVDQVIAVYMASIAEWFTPAAIAEHKLVLFDDQSRATLESEGDRALRTYMRELAPTIEPLLVEEPVEMTLPSGLRVRGKLDLVDTEMRIHDAKFPATMKDGEDLVYEPDAPLYSAFFRTLTGRWPAGFIFDVVSLGRADPTPTKSGKPRKEPTTKAEAIAFPDYARVMPVLVEARLRDLELIDAGILAGVFPRRPSTQNCNKCVYTNACWFGMRPGIKTLGPEDLIPLLQRSVERLRLV